MTFATLPPITITASDYCRLRSLARRALSERHPVGDFLFSELGRAEIAKDSELSKDHVRMGAWVTFRTDWRWDTERRLLVYPDDYRRSETQLSVLSPVGAALVGLPIGTWMPYRTGDGRTHVVRAESIDPERALLSFLPASRRKRRANRPNRNPDDPGPAAA
jgi:regulator of nucleoside diphosphate kinase